METLVLFKDWTLEMFESLKRYGTRTFSEERILAKEKV